MATTSSTSAISLSMPSGLDDTSIINQLVSLEQAKVTTVQNQKAKDQVQVDAYSQIRGLLEDVKTKAAALSDSSSFDVFTPSSTNSSAVSITGGSGSVDGQYDVTVSQTAASEKMISADGRITDQKASLSSQGVTVGDISIAGTKITIGASDTIQDVRSKINAATDAKGQPLGVTASVIMTSASNYRLVLVAKNTGAAGVDYQDVSGSTLQDLGIITDAAGDKGSVSQQVQSSDDIASAWNALAVGSSLHFEGTDHNGQAVSNTFIKNANSTLSDVLKKISTSFDNTATATTDASGHLVLTDSTGGSSQMNISKLTVGGTDCAVNVTQGGENGAGVLSVGKDAFFNVDGLLMQSSTNTITGFASGTTISLNSSTAGQPVTVALTRDLSAVETKINDLITSYNSLATYATTATKFADPNNTSSQDGDLAGDMTVSSIVSKVRSAFSQDYNKLGGTMTNFAMLGIQTDPNSGALSLDDTKFQSACATNFQAVENLFTTAGVSSSPNITMGLNTANTQSGIYDLEEVDPQTVRIRLQGTSDWYSAQRVGDVVNFTDGPAKDLALSVPAGSINGTATFTLSKGISSVLTDAITNLDDPSSGLVALQQTSLQQSMADCDSRITDLQTRVDQYHDRLVKQFAAMESAISNIQSESARITGTFGSTATSSS